MRSNRRKCIWNPCIPSRFVVGLNAIDSAFWIEVEDLVRCIVRYRVPHFRLSSSTPLEMGSRKVGPRKVVVSEDDLSRTETYLNEALLTKMTVLFRLSACELAEELHLELESGMMALMLHPDEVA